MSLQNRIRTILLLFLLSGSLRTLWVLYNLQQDPQRAMLPDSPSYIRPAHAILQDLRFSAAPGSERPEFFRTPGYPLFLSGVFALFGTQNVLAVCLIQAWISAATVLLVFRIGEHLWNAETALLGSLLTCFEPLQIVYNASVMTEALYTFFLVLFVLLALSLWKGEHLRWFHYAATGLAVSVATLIRPGTYYFLLAPVFLLLLKEALVGLKERKIRTEEWKETLKRIGLYLAPVIVLIGGWQLRNQLLLDSWRLSSVDSRSLYLTRAAGVIALREGIPFKAARDKLRKQLGKEKRNETPGEYYQRMRQEGAKIIRQHPQEVLTMTIRGFIKYAGGAAHLPGWLGMGRNVTAVRAAQILLIAFYIFVFAGIFLSVRANPWMHTFLLSLLLYITVISITNPLTFDRYRAPIMPILCLYAAAAMVTVVRVRVRTR